MLGLFAFFYACLHLLVFVFVYKEGDWGGVVREVFKRKFIFFGMGALLLMVPLAATSTVWAIKKMGAKRWKLLHKLAYISAASAAIHYLMQPKADRRQPLVFAGVLAGLLLFRLLVWVRERWFPAKPPRTPVRTAAPS
jgi:sulfoxide reductase heme-binding subunit YedZ